MYISRADVRDLKVVTHHSSDLLHILPAQSTTLDHPHISQSHIYQQSSFSSLVFKSISSHIKSYHQELSLYILWIISQAFYCQGLFRKEYHRHQEYIIVHFLDSLSSIYCQGLFRKEYHRHQEYFIVHFLDSLLSIYCQGLFRKEYHSQYSINISSSGCCLFGVFDLL